MIAETTGLALVCMALVFGVSTLIRRWVGSLQRLHIPTAEIAGVVALLIGPQVLGVFTNGQGLFPAGVYVVWEMLPGSLINVVFGSLLIGRRVPGFAEIWSQSAPHVINGAVISTGQLALASVATAFVLGPLFGMPFAAGALLEMSFSGGHGTVAGLQPQLDMYGASDLGDVGLGLSTVSMVIAVTLGAMLASRAREGEPAAAQGFSAWQQLADIDIGRRSRDRNDPHEPGHATGLSALSSTLMFVGAAIALGWLVLHALRWIEVNTLGTRLFESVPLFPLTIIGSAAVQLLARPLRYEHTLDRRMASDIGGAALDVLIASAIGTLSLAVIGRNLLPILILAILGTVWSLIVFYQLGPRVFPRNGLVHAAADFGHGVGSVATGFVLLELADPEERTEAGAAYAYKQLFYEPLFGGGVVTALAVPVIAHTGLIAFAIASGMATAALIVWGIRRRSGQNV